MCGCVGQCGLYLGVMLDTTDEEEHQIKYYAILSITVEFEARANAGDAPAYIEEEESEEEEKEEKQEVTPVAQPAVQQEVPEQPKPQSQPPPVTVYEVRFIFLSLLSRPSYRPHFVTDAKEALHPVPLRHHHEVVILRPLRIPDYRGPLSALPQRQRPIVSEAIKEDPCISPLFQWSRRRKTPT